MPAPTVHQKVDAVISINGTVLGGPFVLESLRVQHSINRIPTATLNLFDGDAPAGKFPLSAGKKPDLVPGVKVKVAFRNPSKAKNISVFEGILISQTIQVSSQKSLLVLKCKSEAVKLTLGRRSRSFTAQKDSEVLASILQEHGLTAEVKATKVKHPVLIQHDCCDWDFMMMRAEANGLLAFAKGKSFTLAPPDFSQKEDLLLVYPNGIHKLKLTVDARTQLDQATAFSWDPKKQEVSQSKAKAPLKDVPESQGNLKAADLAKAMGQPNVELYHPGNLPKDQLLSWAQGRMLKSRMARVQGNLMTYGLAIDPGKSLTLKGLDSRFNGEAFLTGVVHHYIQGEWLTELHLGMPNSWYINELPGGQHPGNSNHNLFPGLTTATVVKVDKDPESEFRIQVKLWLGEGGTLAWARVAFPNAGANRGLVYWPQVGDEVVVGFMGGDAAFPLVVGTLFSTKNKCPVPPTAENQQSGWVTKEGLQIRLDDKEKSIELSTKGGYKVSINEDKKELVAKDGNGNKFSLSKDGISMQSNKAIELNTKDKIMLSALKGVEIKASTGDVSLKGQNIKHTATLKFSAKGNSGAEVSSTGIAVLKGSLVQIN